MFRQLATQIRDITLLKIMHACTQLHAGMPAHSHCLTEIYEIHRLKVEIHPFLVKCTKYA